MEENKSPNEEFKQAPQETEFKQTPREAEGEQGNRKTLRYGYIGAVAIALFIILGIAWQAGGKTISETGKELEARKKAENAEKKDKKEEEKATDGAILAAVEDFLGEPVKIVSEAAIGASTRRSELLAQQSAAAEAARKAEEEAASKAEAEAKAKAEAEAKARAEEKKAAQTQNQESGNLAQDGGETTYIPSTTKAAQAVDLNAYIDEVIRLVNMERANAGLSPLAKNGGACQAADIRASEIAASFSHTRPNGSACFTVFDELGISYTACGENIAAGHPTPEEVVKGWMNSPGHRANILNGDFEEIGVGVKNVNGSMYWVQLFLRVNW